jgi:hypothetical protein
MNIVKGLEKAKKEKKKKKKEASKKQDVGYEMKPFLLITNEN